MVARPQEHRRELYQMKKVKLFNPYVSLRSKLYALQVLCSDYIAEGKWVKHFEMEFAKKFGFEYFLTTNSGTSALEVIYDTIGIKEGDEVAVSANFLLDSESKLRGIGK